MFILRLNDHQKRAFHDSPSYLDPRNPTRLSHVIEQLAVEYLTHPTCILRPKPELPVDRCMKQEPFPGRTVMQRVEELELAESAGDQYPGVRAQIDFGPILNATLQRVNADRYALEFVHQAEGKVARFAVQAGGKRAE